jgi:outer membrane protein TolC
MTQCVPSTHGAAVRRPALLRVALAFVLAFASSLSVFADDQAQVVTLPQCVDQALANGPDIRISRANLAIARSQYTDAASANALGLGGSAALNHQGAPYDTRLVAIGGFTQATDSAQAGLSLSAPLSTIVNLSAGHSISEETPPGQTSDFSLSVSSSLWDGFPGGRNLASVQQSALTLQVTQSSEQTSQRTVIYQVKQAYYTVLAQQRQLAILQQTLAQRQEELRKTQALFDASSATRIDLQQAQVNATQSDLDLRLAGGNVEIAREKLSALVGWPIDRAYTAAEADDLPVPGLEVETAVKTALAQRPDMKQLQLNLASGDIALALKKGQASPTVSASGSVTWTRDWTRNADSATWNAGVTVKAPIIDAGSNEAQVAQATLQNEKLRIQQEQLAGEHRHGREECRFQPAGPARPGGSSRT